MDKILNAKHWQIFLILFGIPFAFNLSIMGLMMPSTFDSNQPSYDTVLSYFKFFPLIITIVMGTFLYWFWSVGVKLQFKLPSVARLKIKYFRFFVIFPFVYIALLSIFLFYILNTIPLHMNNGSPEFILKYFIIILPFHIFSMFCMWYCVYFTAKTIKSVELQREADLSEYIGEFFMIWFFPIGVWILQPRINKIMNTDYPVLTEQEDEDEVTEEDVLDNIV